MEWMERIRRWRGTLRDDRRRRSLVWLAVLAGLFLLLLPRGEKAAEPTAQDTVSAFDLAETESRLAETLSRIDGAGEVTVMLAVRDGRCDGHSARR